MTKKQKTILSILALIASLLILFTGGYAYYTYDEYAQKPLGPQLPEFTPLALPPTWTPTSGAQPGAVTLAPTIVIPPTNTPPPICNLPDVIYLLAIGADSRQDAYIYGLADMIRVARIETKTPKITVLEFQRDLWVEIPYIADDLNGLSEGKLNQSYLFGQPGFHYWNDPSAGPGLLALTLNQNFGIRSDHYLSVNMRTFENIVNAVDGIDIYIGDEDAAQATGLPLGNSHLDGANALKVARNREEGVFERGKNQNRVLCALQKKLLTPSVLPQIPSLISAFKDNVVTDLTPEEITQLACMGAKLRPQNVTFASFPDELFTPSRKVPDPYSLNPNGTFIWDVDYNILRDYVSQFQAGTWPPAAPIGKTEEGTTCE